MNARRLRLVLAAVLTVATVTGCGHGKATRRTRVESSPAPIPTAVAKTASVTPTLSIAGIIAPFENVAITSSLSEPTLAVYVNEGDRVHRGELLALLDTSDLRANLAAQQALVASDEARISQAQYTADLSYGQDPDAVRQAQANVRSAEATLAQNEQDLARYKQLVSRGYIPGQQYDQQLTQVNTQQAAVRSAIAALQSQVTNQRINGTPAQGLQAANVASTVADANSARAQISQIQTSISRASIVSPVDGIVVNRNLNAGEYPGSRTNFTVQAIAQVYAELNASSADVFRIRAGSPVSLVAGADASGHVYHGKIVAVLGQVQPGATNFTVKALIDNPDAVLQSGIPVTGTISLGKTTGVGIPTEAFLDDTNSSVFEVRDGKAETAKVRLVASSGTTSIVQGLADGTPIVANGQLGLSPGQELAPTPEPSGRARGGPGAGDDAGAPGESPAPGASPGRRHRHRADGDAAATAAP